MTEWPIYVGLWEQRPPLEHTGGGLCKQFVAISNYKHLLLCFDIKRNGKKPRAEVIIIKRKEHARPRSYPEQSRAKAEQGEAKQKQSKSKAEQSEARLKTKVGFVLRRCGRVNS